MTLNKLPLSRRKIFKATPATWCIEGNRTVSRHDYVSFMISSQISLHQDIWCYIVEAVQVNLTISAEQASTLLFQVQGPRPAPGLILQIKKRYLRFTSRARRHQLDTSSLYDLVSLSHPQGNLKSALLVLLH
jgi:hypothetical protein